MATVTTPSSPLKMEYFTLQTDFPSYPRYLYINPYITVNLPSSSLDLLPSDGFPATGLATALRPKSFPPDQTTCPDLSLVQPPWSSPIADSPSATTKSLHQFPVASSQRLHLQPFTPETTATDPPLFSPPTQRSSAPDLLCNRRPALPPPLSSTTQLSPALRSEVSLSFRHLLSENSQPTPTDNPPPPLSAPLQAPDIALLQAPTNTSKNLEISAAISAVSKSNVGLVIPTESSLSSEPKPLALADCQLPQSKSRYLFSPLLSISANGEKSKEYSPTPSPRISAPASQQCVQIRRTRPILWVFYGKETNSGTEEPPGFQVCHSMGGGTGSGMGIYLISCSDIVGLRCSLKRSSKRLSSTSVLNVETKRMGLRGFLFTAPGALHYLSCVIICEEALYQKIAADKPFVVVLNEGVVLSYIKVYRGIVELTGTDGDRISQHGASNSWLAYSSGNTFFELNFASLDWCEYLCVRGPNQSLSFNSICGDKGLLHDASLVKLHSAIPFYFNEFPDLVFYFGIGFGFSSVQKIEIDYCFLMVPCLGSINMLIYFIVWWRSRTMKKDTIVVFVIIGGAFEFDMSNWTRLLPYVEESKRHQKDLLFGIISSLMICVILYVGDCLVITGMVPYQYLGKGDPCAEVFMAKGLKYVSVLVSFGDVAGFTTTLLVGLLVQSRLYLGLGMNGLLPTIVAKVHPTRHTLAHSQIWVGLVAIILFGPLNMEVLSHVLFEGTLTENSFVSACVVTLRWPDKNSTLVYEKRISRISICGFAVGVLYHYDASRIFITLAAVVFVVFVASAYLLLVHTAPPGFSYPGVPSDPCVSIFFNVFLFVQLHYEAWVRFVVLGLITSAVYAFHGHHQTNHSSVITTLYALIVEETKGCLLQGIPNVMVKIRVPMLGPMFHLFVQHASLKATHLLQELRGNRHLADKVVLKTWGNDTPHNLEMTRTKASHHSPFSRAQPETQTSQVREKALARMKYYLE